MAKLRQDERLRRLYMSYVDDGILDIFVGGMALMAALMFISEMVWMAGVYVVIFLPVVWSIKERVTVPRLRQEDLDPKAAQRTKNILFSIMAGLLLFMVLGLLFLLIFQNPDVGAATKKLWLFGASGLVATAVLGGFMFVGAMYHAPRWYIYTAVALLFGIGAWWLSISLPWVIAAVGAVITLTGVIYLLRFLRNHPILPESERPAW